MNYAVIKMKNPEKSLELNDFLKEKYKLENGTFNKSGNLLLELNEINDTNKSIIIALLKFSRTKNFNKYINIVKSENFEGLIKAKYKLI